MPLRSTALVHWPSTGRIRYSSHSPCTVHQKLTQIAQAESHRRNRKTTTPATLATSFLRRPSWSVTKRRAHVSIPIVASSRSARVMLQGPASRARAAIAGDLGDPGGRDNGQMQSMPIHGRTLEEEKCSNGAAARTARRSPAASSACCESRDASIRGRAMKRSRKADASVNEVIPISVAASKAVPATAARDGHQAAETDSPRAADRRTDSRSDTW